MLRIQFLSTGDEDQDAKCGLDPGIEHTLSNNLGTMSGKVKKNLLRKKENKSTEFFRQIMR